MSRSWGRWIRISSVWRGATKDADEVAIIREVGIRTANVVRQTRAFLQSHDVEKMRSCASRTAVCSL